MAQSHEQCKVSSVKWIFIVLLPFDFCFEKFYAVTNSNIHPQASNGGVHSHITHLYALLETVKEIGVPHTYIHFVGDRRDTVPRLGTGYAKDLLAFIDMEKYGKIATVVGRYYAMDRDKHWERIKNSCGWLVEGEGDKVEDVVEAIERKYKQDETDEFLKSVIVNVDTGRIKGLSGNISCSAYYLTPFVLPQRAILYSASTTVPTACVRS